MDNIKLILENINRLQIMKKHIINTQSYILSEMSQNQQLLIVSDYDALQLYGQDIHGQPNLIKTVGNELGITKINSDNPIKQNDIVIHISTHHWNINGIENKYNSITNNVIILLFLNTPMSSITSNHFPIIIANINSQFKGVNITHTITNYGEVISSLKNKINKFDSINLINKPSKQLQPPKQHQTHTSLKKTVSQPQTPSTGKKYIFFPDGNPKYTFIADLINEANLIEISENNYDTVNKNDKIIWVAPATPRLSHEIPKKVDLFKKTIGENIAGLTLHQDGENIRNDYSWTGTAIIGRHAFTTKIHNKGVGGSTVNHILDDFKETVNQLKNF
jgi:hypothetical protein